MDYVCSYYYSHVSFPLAISIFYEDGILLVQCLNIQTNLKIVFIVLKLIYPPPPKQTKQKGIHIKR